MTGRIVHFEIPFDDGDRARKFYGEAFGDRHSGLTAARPSRVAAGVLRCVA
ncbi:MAG: VOC family protein [Nocardioidaceae bacterium]